MDNTFCWGPIHWVSGINEYIMDRCICSGDLIQDDENRGYKTNNITSDCCCVYSAVKHEPDDIKMESECDNLIMGTLCCPLMLVTHLICLPFTCCFCSKESWDKSRIAKYKCFWIYMGCDIDTIEELEKINKEIDILRIEAIKKDFEDYPKPDDDDETFKRKLKNVGKDKNYKNFMKIQTEHYTRQIANIERSGEMVRAHNNIMAQNRVIQQQNYHSTHRY